MAFLPVIVVCAQTVCGSYTGDIQLTHADCEREVIRQSGTALEAMGHAMENPYIESFRCEWTSKVPLRYRIQGAWEPSTNIEDRRGIFDYKAFAGYMLEAIANASKGE